MCRTCAATKPLREFGWRNDTSKYRTECKSCQRDRQLQTRYGLEPGEFEALSERQGHRCAICRTSFKGRWDRLVVDHDHETGEVRGLLCATCNYGLGILGDTVERVESTLRYLTGRI